MFIHFQTAQIQVCDFPVVFLKMDLTPWFLDFMVAADSIEKIGKDMLPYKFAHLHGLPLQNHIEGVPE